MKVLIVYVLVLTTGVLSAKSKARGRILAGEDANPPDFNYQARIVVPELEDGILYVYRCGGSVIHNKWVLTAAHCFDYGNKNETTVLLGYTSDNVHTCERNATDIIIHENYNHVEYELINDIALVKIDFVEFNAYIYSIRLSNMSSLDNEVITVAGWGLINSTTEATSLQYSILTILNSTECTRVFQEVPATQFCTWSYLQVACEGDSGSPAIEGFGNYAKQVGLVSHGTPGCTPNATRVYTRILSYLIWIRRETRNNRL